MAGTDLVDLALAALLLLGGHALRAARWALFFRHEQVFQRFNLLLALALGYSINAVVPGRLGELVRIWFAARRESLRLPYVASTVVAERLADLVVVSAVALVVVGVGGPGDWPGFWVLPLLALALVALGLGVQRSAALRLRIWKLASVFNDDIRLAVVDFCWSFGEHVGKGMLLRGRFLGATVLMWLVYGLSYLTFARACGQGLAQVLQALLGEPLRSAIDLLDGSGATMTLAMLAYTGVPVAGILAYGGFKQFPAIVAILDSRRRYGWYGNRDDQPHVRNRFKAEAEYRFFLTGLFSGSNEVATHFGLQAVEDSTVHRLFAGGSDAVTALVETRGELVIRKFALGQAGERLRLQQAWLQANARQTLPLVGILRSTAQPGHYYYDMPLVVPCSDFYDFIHTNPLSASRDILHEVMSRMDAFHGAHTPVQAPEEVVCRYLQDKVVRNARELLGFAASVFGADRLCVNGVEHALSDWERLTDPAWLQRQLTRLQTTRVHGDMTIENIIVAPGQAPCWYVIDPNPANGFDSPLIDWAKLMQSLHLGYEGLNRNFSCTVDGNRVQLAFTRSMAYSQLHEQLQARIVERLGADGLREVYFHELVNYLRLTPYKIRQNVRKGVCFLACTQILLDRYLALAR